MHSLGKLIQKHMLSYPLSELSDILTLVYQNEFGPLCADHTEETASKILHKMQESQAASNPRTLSEPIGNGFARVHCASFGKLFDDKILASKVLSSMAAVSAEVQRGSFEGVSKKLGLLLRLVENNELAGSGDTTFKSWVYNYEQSRKEVDKFLKVDYPEVSHSDDYLSAYNPSYRVVLCEFLEYVDLFKLIQPSISFGRRVILGIDGRSGAGKTTLAKIVSKVYGGDFISMDNFYLPFELRSLERMGIPGGHIHYERFIEQILNPIKAGKTRIEHENYSPHTKKTTPLVANINSNIVVVEGSYSLHPWIRDLHTHTVFLNASDALQKRRILKRNGKEGYVRFKSTWIPFEDRYHRAYKVDKYCNISI